jgi:sterol desaturase/sphingolipid hydroxylase (fatty acid hydroxylase superfamily)
VRGWRSLTPTGLVAQFNEEHLLHHANPFYFAATWRKVAAALVIVPMLGAVASLLAGPALGVPFALGFGAVYGFYEVVHRRIHVRAPLGAYGRWVRRHHLTHHFKSPRSNHGVTAPLFDVLFGTEAGVPEQLVVPRKGAPLWLLDDAGAVRSAHRADYALPQR